LPALSAYRYTAAAPAVRIGTVSISGLSRPVALKLTLPLPPGVNNQYVTVGKRRVLSATAKSFHRDVAKHISALRTAGLLSADTEQVLGKTPIGVYLVYYFETPHRRDLDGGLKITLDALSRCLGFDDRAIVDLHLSKKIDPLHPRVEIELETIAGWEFDRTYQYLGEQQRSD
jgi:crossover junction endodeoxyribonuclease RusA